MNERTEPGSVNAGFTEQVPARASAPTLNERTEPSLNGFMNYQASFQALYTAHTRACSWHVLRVRAIALPGRGLAPHLAGASAIPRRAIDGSYEATKATGQELIDRNTQERNLHERPKRWR